MLGDPHRLEHSPRGYRWSRSGVVHRRRVGRHSARLHHPLRGHTQGTGGVGEDPRLSIEERYETKEQYLELVEQAAEDQIGQRYLLEEDLESVLGQAAQLYDYLTSRVAETQAAD